MKHFSRSIAMFAAISAIMQKDANDFTKNQQITALGKYESRGKGGRKSPRTVSGVARARREAKKQRNKAA